MKVFLLGFILVILPVLGFSESIRALPGERHGSGIVIQFPNPPFTFIIPEGYGGRLSSGGNVFVFEKEGRDGYVLLIAVPETSIEDLKQLLYQYLPYENEVYLIPTAMPEADGDRVTAFYTGGDGVISFRGRGLAIIHRNGTAAAFFALGPAETIEAHAAVLGQVANSLSFESPQHNDP
jgi:hypothetical protein